MKFTKMHGTGNDFIVIEDLDGSLKGKENYVAQKLCHRRFAIGADGILLVRKSDIADIEMEIINADGSYAAMCGNGIRCFAKYVFDKRIVEDNRIKIKTGDGIKIADLTLEDGKVSGVTINMGNYSLDPKDIPAEANKEIINKTIIANHKEYNITSMLMGVPHTIIMCKLDDIDIEEGKYIEKHNMFHKGTNVNFCEVISRNVVKVKTWERGAGPTLACGTGSCASVVATKLLGYTDDEVRVLVPGGELIIKLLGKDVFMTGPAVTVFEGETIL
ncbi:diaminopimelate epimerase [Clostridium bovifaecis]|uniref:Diaminopimelate epimerase n=1 Tax=Clostridium bovifaecis TaxID=2184719 RepID=A0A6I6ERT7_9CLOT|nr:diaminopimelate epimerase [Clostridium bovifaecis]